MTGSTDASHCATQPINATVADNYAQNSMPTITLIKIHRLNLKFPEFSRFSRVVSTLNELHTKPSSWQVPDQVYMSVVHGIRCTIKMQCKLKTNVNHTAQYFLHAHKCICHSTEHFGPSLSSLMQLGIGTRALSNVRNDEKTYGTLWAGLPLAEFVHRFHP